MKIDKENAFKLLASLALFLIFVGLFCGFAGAITKTAILLSVFPFFLLGGIFFGLFLFLLGIYWDIW